MPGALACGGLTSPSNPSDTSPTAAPTPDPLFPYTIDGLRARAYPGGPIEIIQVVEQPPAFTRYLIAYASDGLRITGLMNVPAGEEPFPVVILNHPYYDQRLYVTGLGTREAADYFAQRGYLTLAPDYRLYGGSDPGPDPFRTGMTVDVLNLIASVKSLPQARADSIGLWGHSMGGGIVLTALTVNPPSLRAAVLYSAMSGDAEDNYRLIAASRGPEPLGPDWPFSPEENPATYARMSPLNYLAHIGAPVLIHQGQNDPTVPPAWSLRLAQALTDAGKDVAYYAYPNASHFFVGADWMLAMQRNVEFFDRRLK